MSDQPTSGDQAAGADDRHPAYQPGAGAEPPPWARTTAQSPWSADPRGQWSRPYDYRPAWSQAPGYAPEPGSSPLAVIAATVLLVVGALVTLFSLLVLVAGAAGEELLDQAAIEAGLDSAVGLAAVLVVVGAFMLVIGILHMVAAVGVFAHKEWARWLGIALAALGLALGALLALGSLTDAGGLVISIVWLSAYVAALGGLAAGGEQFQPARSRRQ